MTDRQTDRQVFLTSLLEGEVDFQCEQRPASVRKSGEGPCFGYSFFKLSRRNIVSPRNDARAFTLAEVLITLGIIGIVAAMAIPTLINKAQDSANASAAKKIYSGLSNATNIIISENGGTFADALSTGTEVRDIFARKLLAIKKCDNASSEGCFPSTYKYGPNSNFVKYAGLVLNDGMMVSFNFYPGNYSLSCNLTHGSATGVCFEIWVDTNGAKAPNIGGKDIVGFILYKNGLRVAGTNHDYYESVYSAYNCITGTNPFLCQLEFFK